MHRLIDHACAARPRLADDERYTDFFFVDRLAMTSLAMLGKGLTVIRSDRDQHVGAPAVSSMLFKRRAISASTRRAAAR